MKISIKNITMKYGKKVALDEVNLVFGPHIYGLIGPNGSGKTSLIRIMTHLIEPKEGTVIYDENGNNLPGKSLKIGYLSQTFSAFKDLTVYEQLKYFAILKKIDKSKHNEEILRVLELVNLLDKKSSTCKSLSGGMIRRVGIAQAMLGTPHFIILDEPTAGLDPDERIRFKEIVQNIKLQIPIIISTHIIEDIHSLCTEVVFLKEGKVRFDGKTEDFVGLIKNNVYTCDFQYLKEIKENVVTSHIKDNEYKVIAATELKYAFLKPTSATIEDAYFYFSHGENSE